MSASQSLKSWQEGERILAKMPLKIEPERQAAQIPCQLLRVQALLLLIAKKKTPVLHAGAAGQRWGCWHCRWRQWDSQAQAGELPESDIIDEIEIYLKNLKQKCIS